MTYGPCVIWKVQTEVMLNSKSYRSLEFSTETVQENHLILKKFQQDDTFVQFFYFPQAALHVSGETFTHHQELN
jgi:hypothetical protein